MAAGRFSKQAAPFVQYKYLNPTNFNGDTLPGGVINTSPGGNTAVQFQQNLPGDRIILDPISANALSSNNGLGTQLYTGTYRYYGTNNNSSSSPTKGHAVFFVNGNGSNVATDSLYQVTSDEPANNGYALFAGVSINNDTKGNWDWHQEAGKATVKFRTALTGTPAIGAGVYLAAGGNNNNAADVGAFDQLTAANSAAIFTANSTTGYTTVDNMLVRYMGPAETLPSNNNLSIVDINFGRAYRW